MTSSWWTDAKPDNFTALASQQKFKQDKIWVFGTEYPDVPKHLQARGKKSDADRAKVDEV